MEDDISLLNNMPKTAEWHEKAESAVNETLTIYSNICYKFQKDKKYGEDFVDKNQDLMGYLTIAASKLIKKI